MSKDKFDKSQYIGVTEAGEVAFDLTVFDRLYDGNVIITKRLTDKLIEKLIEFKDKIILHCTCTGMGGTKIEPFVPTYEQTYDKLKKLIDDGFPVSHVVLRIDPVIATDKGIATACKVIEKFKDLGIKRVRFSVLDMYDHVKKRFNDEGIRTPYTTFHADYLERQKIYNTFVENGRKYNFDVETCAEPGFASISCLSMKDIEILGLTDKIKLFGSAGQRKTCMCPSNKHELIKVKPHRCNNKCLYCFWKDGNDAENQ